MRKDTSGEAFPRPRQGESGLSKRQFVAALVMHGFIAHGTMRAGKVGADQDIRNCYAFADAFLAENECADYAAAKKELAWIKKRCEEVSVDDSIISFANEIAYGYRGEATP